MQAAGDVGTRHMLPCEGTPAACPAAMQVHVEGGESEANGFVIATRTALRMQCQPIWGGGLSHWQLTTMPGSFLGVSLLSTKGDLLEELLWRLESTRPFFCSYVFCHNLSFYARQFSKPCK